MLSAVNPGELISVCQRLQQKNAVGVLLSGGSNTSGGMLNLDKMLATISRIRQETNLILNIHPGVMSTDTIKYLDVDFASLEIPSDETIHDTFGLRLRREDYINTYHLLRHAGIQVVPHVCVYNGTEDILLDGIEIPETVVIIVFSPTRGTSMADAPSPTPDMVKRVVRRIRQKFPAAEISLGCMRSRERDLRYGIEVAALEGGATRIELPLKKTLVHAKSLGFTTIVSFDACCALPNYLEKRAKTQSPALR
jgi:uncharacterized radical SAM superfamily protein